MNAQISNDKFNNKNKVDFKCRLWLILEFFRLIKSWRQRGGGVEQKKSGRTEISHEAPRLREPTTIY